MRQPPSGAWILVLEDSRKAGMGGGQRGTIEIIDALSPHYALLLGDTSETGRFAEAADRRGLPRILLRATRRLSTGGALNLDWREYMAYPFHLVSNLIRLRRALRGRASTASDTLVYVGHKKQLPLARLIQLLWGIGYVAHARTIDPRDHRLFGFLRHLYARARRVVAVSRAVAENLRLPNVLVLPNPLTLEVAASPKAATEPFVVGVFASLIDSKGIDVFMRSHPLLRHAEEITYEIYGTGPMEEVYRRLESSRVRLMGWTDRVPQVMAERIALTCVPSTTPESFGRVVLEGFSQGIPCVASDLGGVRELIEDGVNGLLVPPGDPQALAESIDRLYEDRDARERLGRGSLETARRFGYARYADRVREVFRDAYRG